MNQMNHKTVAKSSKILLAQGYLPAVAEKYLEEKRYSKVVEICKEELKENSDITSVRLIYARALFYTGQIEIARKEFFKILSIDPENIVALKYLGDIKFEEGKEEEAIIDYNKILEIDPHCQGIACLISRNEKEKASKVKMIRQPEIHSPGNEETTLSIDKIQFYTETMGDLYQEQGFTRLAAEIYKKLNEKISSPRLSEKLSKVEKMLEKGE